MNIHMRLSMYLMSRHESCRLLTLCLRVDSLLQDGVDDQHTEFRHLPGMKTKRRGAYRVGLYAERGRIDAPETTK